MRQNRRRYNSSNDMNYNTSLMDILGNGLGAVLFFLLMAMGIMVFLPQLRASLKHLKILGGSVDSAVILSHATVGQEYQAMFASEGGDEYINFELVDGSFPPGLKWVEVKHEGLGTTTHAGIEGIPTSTGNYSFRLLAKSYISKEREQEANDWPEQYKISPSKIFRISVLSAAVKTIDQISKLEIVTSPNLPPARLSKEGTASLQIAAKGGIEPYLWSVDWQKANNDVQVVSITDTGQVNVKAEKPSVISFEVTAKSSPPAEPNITLQADHKVDKKEFTLMLLPSADDLEITTPEQLPTAIAGQMYKLALGARGGTGTYTWSLKQSPQQESLPSWLQIKGSTLTFAPPPDAFKKEEPYSFLISVNDGQPGQAPVSKLVKLTVNARALIEDSNKDKAQKVTITTREELPAATAETIYGLTFAAQGGRPPYHWKINDCQLVIDNKSTTISLKGIGLNLVESDPEGLSSGWLSGTPNNKAAGDYLLAIQVWGTDQTGKKGSSTDQKTVKLKIRQSPDTAKEPLRIITPPHLPDATEDIPYEVALSGLGGILPYKWSVDSNAPSFIAFKEPQMGLLSGKPDNKAVGTYRFAIILSDGQGSEQAVRQAVTLIVHPGKKPLSIKTTQLHDAALGRTYEAFIVTEGGQPPFLWSIAKGALPAGLTLEEKTGRVTGKPTKLSEPSKPSQFTVQVAQNDGANAQADLTVTVSALIQQTKLRILSYEVLPPAVVNKQGYKFQFAAEGGIPPYTWKKGNLWPDMTAGNVVISDSGRLSNELLFPTVKNYDLDVEVADATGQNVSGRFRLPVMPEEVVPEPLLPLKITTSEELPPVIAGKKYNLAFSAQGGKSPYQWSIDKALPKELHLENGHIIGSVKAKANVNIRFKAQVSDSQNPSEQAQQEMVLPILAGSKEEWWKYFGFAAIVVIYVIIKRGIDGWLYAERQQLINNGLQIIEDSTGVHLAGLNSLQNKCIKLYKSHRGYLWALRLVCIGLAIAYGWYLFKL